MTEHALFFGTERNLVGIVTDPEPGVPPNGLGAIFVNAGVVHRVGPNRLYVNAARALARLGFVSARFDLPGIGDSPTRRDARPFEQAAVEETGQVMSDLQERYGVRRFVLIGLCSGAVVSFNAAVADARVAGAILINPQGFGGSAEFTTYVVDRGQARRYVGKLFSLRSWRRALTGRSDYRQALELIGKRWRARRGEPAEVAEFSRGVAGDFRGLVARGVRLLLVCSGGDYSLDYLDVIMGPEFRRLDRRGFLVQELPSGDHSLTMWRSQQIFLGAMCSWASSLAVSAERRPMHAAQRAAGELPYGVISAPAGGSSE